jgi:hypothetical protein
MDPLYAAYRFWEAPKCRVCSRLDSELPILTYRFDGPIELLTKGLGEEFLNWDIELLAEDSCKSRINVIL